MGKIMNKNNCYWRVLVRENDPNIFYSSIALCTQNDNGFIYLIFYLDSIEVEIAKTPNILKYDYKNFVKVFEKLGFEKEGEEYIDYAPCQEEWYLDTYFLVKESHEFTFDELIEFLRKLTKELNGIENSEVTINDKIGIYETEENFEDYSADFDMIDFWY